MNEIVAGAGRTFSQVAALVPAHRGPGEPADKSTVWRWAVQGARTADGRTVRLEAARVGGRWLTTRQALGRFVAALTPAAEAPAPAARKPAEMSKAAAARHLEAAGC